LPRARFDQRIELTLVGRPGREGRADKGGWATRHVHAHHAITAIFR